MRWLLPSLLVLAALAGCATPDESGGMDSGSGAGADTGSGVSTNTTAEGGDPAEPLEVDATARAEEFALVTVGPESAHESTLRVPEGARNLTVLLDIQPQGSEATVTATLAGEGASEATEQVSVAEGGGAVVRLALEELGDAQDVTVRIESSAEVQASGTVYFG